MQAQPPGSPASRATEPTRPGAPIPDGHPRTPALFPLSPAQEGLWLLDQLGSETATYNFPIAVRWSGAVDEPALRRAVNLLVARQESLRTRFLTGTEGPVQAVDPELTIDLAVVDLRDIPDRRREFSARHHARTLAAARFDLARGPLITATLLRLAPQDHVFVAVLPHIVTDGWSRSVLLADLAACYASCLTGRPAGLPELAVQYGDYATWQRQRYGPQRLDQALRHWVGELAGTVPLGLVPDCDRSPWMDRRGGRVLTRIPAGLVAALSGLGRRHGATLYMTLLAAFQALLYRYTGQPDVAVGSPVADRDLPELRPLIGLFVDTVVLRADLSGDPRFSDLLGRTRATCLRAFEHPVIPVEPLITALGITRVAGRNSLFQALFAVQDAPAQAPPPAGTTAEDFDFGPPPPLVDLHLECSPAPGGDLMALLVYQVDLLTAPVVEAMARDYLTLLGAVVARPDGRISQSVAPDAADAHPQPAPWRAR